MSYWVTLEAIDKNSSLACHSEQILFLRVRRLGSLHPIRALEFSDVWKAGKITARLGWAKWDGSAGLLL